jgi:malonyl-CoA decarboxylase
VRAVFGNAAPHGIQESFGIMANYLYDVETVGSNHEAFVNDGTVIRSADVDALLAAEHGVERAVLRKHTTP